MQNMLITLQIYDDFWNVIMHCDSISCVIYISNKVEYLEKEESQKNSTTEVILLFKQSLPWKQKTVGQDSMS